MRTLSIAVVCGGRSSEAEVSRMSGREVQRALAEAGHECALVEADDSLWERLRSGNFDVAFLALHGRWGEDGTVQGMCELLGLPYTGSGVLASALCFDKVMTKRVIAAEGVRTPRWVAVSRSSFDVVTEMRAAVDKLGLPMVVKPVQGGSTIGLTIARGHDDLEAAHRLAAEESYVLCEEFIAGCEITVGVLGHNPPRALPTLEIVSHRPLYDYAAKYTKGQSEHVIPARLPEEQRAAAQEAALTAHQVLGCRDLSRVDVIVDESGTPWVLEVNSIPGLTELSLLPDAARAAGIAFSELCEQLVEAAYARGQQPPR